MCILGPRRRQTDNPMTDNTNDITVALKPGQHISVSPGKKPRRFSRVAQVRLKHYQRQFEKLPMDPFERLVDCNKGGRQLFKDILQHAHPKTMISVVPLPANATTGDNVNRTRAAKEVSRVGLARFIGS